ncbi:MAG: MIP/aquaporin family protein [Pyrinomonadaceae bacterium]
MLNALRRHWREYLMEAAGLSFFMISAGVFTTLFEHPDSPAQQAMGSNPLLRRVILGALLGGVIAIIVYAPSGKRSGGHINPAVTWAFFRLGKIKGWDVIFYTLAQFGGAILTALMLKLLLGKHFAHPSVNYSMTLPAPGAHGTRNAFLAEFLISFILMFVVLLMVNSARLEKLLGIIAGVLIAVYIVVELPFSGMSLNPARSFGSAFAAGHYMDLWVYFVAPMLSMLLAAELYLRLRDDRRVAAIMLRHRHNPVCVFWDYKEGPNYPVEERAEGRA